MKARACCDLELCGSVREMCAGIASSVGYACPNVLTFGAVWIAAPHSSKSQHTIGRRTHTARDSSTGRPVSAAQLANTARAPRRRRMRDLSVGPRRFQTKANAQTRFALVKNCDHEVEVCGKRGPRQVGHKHPPGGLAHPKRQDHQGNYHHPHEH